MKQSVLLMSMVAAMCGSSCGLAHAESPVPPEIVTARREFSIPFRYDRRELNRLGARAVVLSVSRDNGSTWRQATTVPISEDHFRFQAAEDGNYWFAVSVQGADNQLHPQPETAVPGLKVLVDHAKPKIQLSLTRPTAQQVELAWNVADATLDLNTLAMDYRYSSTDEWKRVYIAAQASGRTTWKIPDGAQPEVRCRIADRAGNQAEQRVTVSASIQQAAAVSGQPAPPVIEPAAKSTAGPLPHISPGKAKANSAQELPQIAGQHSSTPGPSLMAPVTTGVEEPSHGKSTGAPRRPAPSIPVRGEPLQVAADNGSTVHEAASNELASDSEEQALPKFVPSRAFEIEYQVTGAGPSGVGVVEVYITQDNGLQWWRYGVDPDCQSPMEIRVPADGQYGFCFRIHSGVGNAEPPPQPGHAPQILVQVDSTAPHLEVLRTKQGRGVHLREVTVDWDHMDENPTDSPLDVFIAGSSDGPWQMIDKDLVDRGTHTFQLPANPPAKLFVKLRATDSAGNMTEAISAEPILLDLARPTARILMVDPVK